ncbi:hypothetical protein CPAR01_05542 [Colletotrichum paranaense]|uniref:Uncharacterized protein n=2 Tax=Colletotrichum acutatum species complex TaxID=2707335 RepID=A0AAI9U1Y3_9PEZI|nr:uncharacterized protein CPAR01_05542 [Colletotrichum paranaense]KAK1450155.1 hypothetical protein CMEL01_07491 [Colletotrichum melonis]KAK1542155.1 hypothetical protein CPAR01_05542 [Colletotrichum paranaense]
MLPATFVALAAALAPVLAGPVAGPVAEPEGALQQLEARKVCGAGYLACHYRFGNGDKDQSEYTCMSPWCTILKDCSCPKTASFSQKPAFLFDSGCRSKAAAGNHPTCLVVG